MGRDAVNVSPDAWTVSPGTADGESDLLGVQGWIERQMVKGESN